MRPLAWLCVYIVYLLAVAAIMLVAMVLRLPEEFMWMGLAYFVIRFGIGVTQTILHGDV